LRRPAGAGGPEQTEGQGDCSRVSPGAQPGRGVRLFVLRGNRVADAQATRLALQAVA
jgi:hypothetical protein